LEKNRPEWNRISEALRKGVEEGVFPGALALVGREGKVAFLGKSGYRSLKTPEKGKELLRTKPHIMGSCGAA